MKKYEYPELDVLLLHTEVIAAGITSNNTPVVPPGGEFEE